MKNKAVACLLLFWFFSLQVFAQTEKERRERIKHAKREKYQFPKRQNSAVVLLSVGGLGGYAAVAPGLEYERFLTKKNKLSVMVQAAVFVNGTFTLGYRTGDVSVQTTGFYIVQGVRYHPFGNQRRLDLGIGGSFAIGNSNQHITLHGNTGHPLSPPYSDRKTLSAVLGQLSCHLPFQKPCCGRV